MPDGRLLKLEEVAYKLGVSYMKARQLVLYDEAIPHQKVGARGIRVREADLEAYMTKMQGREEAQSGSKRDTGDKDRREPYTGRQILGDRQ